MTILEVKNDELLGRTNDGIIAVKFYAMQKQIDDLQQRFAKIKDYLKQVHIEQQNGILSSNNLIWDNIIRLCEGLEIIRGKNEK